MKAIACRGLADARALERGPIRCDLVEFDYAAIAKAMGSHAIRVSDPETVADFFCVYQSVNYADPDNIAYAAHHSSRNGNWQNPVYKKYKN